MSGLRFKNRMPLMTYPFKGNSRERGHVYDYVFFDPKNKQLRNMGAFVVLTKNALSDHYGVLGHFRL